MEGNKTLVSSYQKQVPWYKNIHKESLIMANQTLPLDVSYEMNKNEIEQEKGDMSVGENLYSSLLDTHEELCSSSAPDACWNGSIDVKG